MSSYHIEAILITDRSGSPRFYLQLDPLAFGMDPALASSFFAAIDMFSQEVFEKSTPVIQIDYGSRVFTIIHGVNTNLVAICGTRLTPEILKILDSLLAEFELEWLAVAETFNLEDSFIDIYLEAFGEIVLKRLSLQELPDSWVACSSTKLGQTWTSLRCLFEITYRALYTRSLQQDCEVDLTRIRPHRTHPLPFHGRTSLWCPRMSNLQ